MKTINSNGVYKRVDNEIAEYEVRFGRANYVPKSEWKVNVRDLTKTKEVEVTSEVVEKKKNYQKPSKQKKKRS